MAKTTMVLKMFCAGTWRVIKEEGKVNPYAVKFTRWDNGLGRFKTMTLQRFGDLESCLHYLAFCVSEM